MTVSNIRAQWDRVRAAASDMALLADEIGGDLAVARTAGGTLLLPAGCESRMALFETSMAEFDSAVHHLAPSK